MDHRLPLKIHSVLAFDGMHCHVEEVTGSGSNAIVYRGYYADRLNPELRHEVLIKELFPFHPEKRIWRDEENRIHVENDAREVFETHRRSFEEGNKIHLRLLAQYPQSVGANLNSFRLNGTLYSILGFSGGRSLAQELDTPDRIPLRRHVQRMIRLLDALEAFHAGGYLHLDISPDNMMIIGKEDTEQVFLIDYNSARSIGSDDHLVCSFKAGYSAPEVELHSVSAIGYASDLYSVAAVFYRCLTGRALTLEETLRSKAPDISGCLSDTPQTVSSMVSRILKKGLHTLPGKRYQSIGQMRQAFCELTDRIDCVGVTHWSLWENGRRSTEELIRINPSLRYAADGDKLYPIRLQCQGGNLPLERYLENMLSPNGHSGLILAQGGMGKTTLLLHTALMQGKRYSPGAPAVFYISLSGWNQGDTQYIRSRILMTLRFKREQNTFDSALHTLNGLMEKPLHTKTGPQPVVLLLLDGLNEIQGNAEPLIQEINALSAMDGVRIIAASRSPVPALALQPVELVPLEKKDVEQALTEHGLLMPKHGQMLQLLRTPMILSIYLKTAESGIHPDIQSEQELMGAYLDALYRKELLQLSENAPERWQLAAALDYVLPCIAAQARRTGYTLTEVQLLKTVSECWGVLRSRNGAKLFPQWIGHSPQILNGTETAEQWFGLMIHTLLWQRLGLLVKEPDGVYRIFHQRIADYLAEGGFRLIKRIRRKKLSHRAAIAAAMLCLMLLGGWLIIPRSYDAEKTELAIDAAASCYGAYGHRLSELQELTAMLLQDDVDDFLTRYDRAADAASKEAELTQREMGYLTQIDDLCRSADQVAWSGLPFDGELAQELVSVSSERMAYYLDHLSLLKAWAQSGKAQENYPEYPELFSQLLDADARLMSKLYHQTCVPHLDGGNALWKEAVEAVTAQVPMAGSEPEENLEYLRSAQQQSEDALARISAGVRLTCEEEGLLSDKP